MQPRDAYTTEQDLSLRLESAISRGQPIQMVLIQWCAGREENICAEIREGVYQLEARLGARRRQGVSVTAHIDDIEFFTTTSKVLNDSFRRQRWITCEVHVNVAKRACI